MGQGPPGTHRHTPHCLVSEPMGYLYRRRPHQKPGQKLATVLTTPFYQDPHHLAVGHLVFHTTYGLLVMAWPGRTPPLGNLRLLLSHHRALAYRSNRDSLRAIRGAPPSGSPHTALWGRCRRPNANNPYGPVCTLFVPSGTSAGTAKTGRSPPIPPTHR